MKANRTAQQGEDAALDDRRQTLTASATLLHPPEDGSRTPG
jgi:hypothetical protein